jgi:hypothetical protein
VCDRGTHKNTRLEYEVVSCQLSVASDPL